MIGVVFSCGFPGFAVTGRAELSLLVNALGEGWVIAEEGRRDEGDAAAAETSIHSELFNSRAKRKKPEAGPRGPAPSQVVHARLDDHSTKVKAMMLLPRL